MKLIQVVEQKTVLFYDDSLIAVRGADGHVYVSIRHLCDNLGLSRPAQVRRIKRNEILEEGYQGGAILAPPSADGRGGGKQTASLLRADLLPLWLSTLSTKSVKEDIRPKIIQYQKEAAKVLWEAFQDGRLSVDPTFSELLKNEDSPSVQAYKMLQSMMRLAQQQIMLEARVDHHEERIEQLEAIVDDTKHRITQAQASHISQAVKTIAMELGTQTNRSEYGAVYGELYRRFEIVSYKQLPKNRYDDAMNFLKNWHAEITDSDEVPF